jgi:hypothetical protein
MDDLKSKCILVRDTGYFVSFAERLARDFGRVIYHNPAWKIGSPKSQQAQLGKNVADNIEVALDFWDVLSEADIVACPDIYEGDVTAYLRKMGMPVFGSGKGEELEIDRWYTKELLEDLGLPVPASKLIHGIDDLEAYLQDNEDCYVKFPRWRGDTETWHHIDMFMSQEWFNTLKKDLGPSGEMMQFVIEEPVGDIEVGFDGICMDGQFLPVASYGYEIKDAAHVARFLPYAQVPKPIRDINEKMAAQFESYQYRGLYSNDIRVDGKNFYLTDPCCRFASPVGELMLEGFTNYSDIIWGVANGEIVKPEIKYGYGAALTLFSESKGWIPVQIPDEHRNNVKLHYWSRFNDMDYITPITGAVSSVGVVIALADTLQSAIERVITVAKEVKMPGLTFDEAAFESAEEQIQNGRKVGINW